MKRFLTSIVLTVALLAISPIAYSVTFTVQDSIAYNQVRLSQEGQLKLIASEVDPIDAVVTPKKGFIEIKLPIGGGELGPNTIGGRNPK